jgi:hypothetical protein
LTDDLWWVEVGIDLAAEMPKCCAHCLNGDWNSASNKENSGFVHRLSQWMELRFND